MKRYISYLIVNVDLFPLKEKGPLLLYSNSNFQKPTKFSFLEFVESSDVFLA